MSMKEFLKKYGAIVIITTIILLSSVLILILLFRDDEISDVDFDTERPVPSDGLPIVEQPLGYHKNYTISFQPSVLEKLEDFAKVSYPSFRVRDVDHFQWAEEFASDILQGNVEYSESSPSAEIINHYWEDGENAVSYDFNRDVLFFTLTQGTYLPEIRFDPNNSENVEENLNNIAKNYFSPDFDYEVENITREGNDYRAQFSRLLGNYPVYIGSQSEYLILTPDGRLKEGLFLLTEFVEQENVNYPIISSEEIVSEISSMEYPKNVEFFNLPDEIEDEYIPYGYQVYSDPFLQRGEVDVSDARLVYFYVNRGQEVLVVNFLFDGVGDLDVEGELARADFKILASAISFEYVFVPPTSFFEELGGGN